MNKAVMTAAGILAGMAVAGTVGLLMSESKAKPRKITKRAANAVESMGETISSLMKIKP